MAVHRGVSRAAMLRLSGAALIAAGILAAGTAFAAPDPAPAGASPDILGNVTGLVGGLLDSAESGDGAAGAARGGDDGYGNGGSGNGGYGNGGSSGTTRGGASAVGSGVNANSIGNAGAGSGNQIGTSGQAPVDVGCNGLGVLGSTVSGGCGQPRTVHHPKPHPSTAPPSTPPTTKKPPTQVLAQTGTDASGLGWIGGGLLVAGASLVLVARRRPASGARHAA